MAPLGGERGVQQGQLFSNVPLHLFSDVFPLPALCWLTPLPGLDTGMAMEMTLSNYQGAKGQRKPEVLVQVQVLPDPVFERNGQDLHVEVPISFAQATLGASVTVPTLTGQIKLKVGAPVCAPVCAPVYAPVGAPVCAPVCALGSSMRVS